MNCHDVQQALIEVVYGDLPVAVRRGVEAHRATCASCAQAWASLHALQQVLGQWQDVVPPADLRARVLAQVAAQRVEVPSGARWRRGLVSTGLSVGAGLAMMVATVLLLARFLALEDLAPWALLICGSLWGGAYVGLFRLALSEASWPERRGVPGGLQLARAAWVALLAVGVATLLLVLLTGLRLGARLESLFPPPWLPFLGGGVVALLALGVSSWGLGRRPSVRPLLHALLAACFFLLAVAPGLLMFCVPFTLGVYAGLLLAVGLGAGAGGALGVLLRTWDLRPAEG